MEEMTEEGLRKFIARAVNDSTVETQRCAMPDMLDEVARAKSALDGIVGLITDAGMGQTHKCLSATPCHGLSELLEMIMERLEAAEDIGHSVRKENN